MFKNYYKRWNDVVLAGVLERMELVWGYETLNQEGLWEQLLLAPTQPRGWTRGERKVNGLCALKMETIQYKRIPVECMLRWPKLVG
jgi:hypothetical protein